MEHLWAPLRRSAVQRGIRAALAAGIAWQIAVLLPPPFSEQASYAPLGAIIAVLPTVADSASAAWRTVLAILIGSGLAVAVHAITPALPQAITLAVIVALAVVIEQWRVLGQNASWVGVAAVFTLTLGSDGDPTDFVVAYAGLVLLGATVGVLVTTLLFPPLPLTQAGEQVQRVRELLATHLERTGRELRRGELPTAEEELRRTGSLEAALDRMRQAEHTVQRAQRANPRAPRWRDSADALRTQARALERVGELVDDVTLVVALDQPQRRGGERPELGTAQRLAAALEGLAGVVRTPDHSADGGEADERDRRIAVASEALDDLVARLRLTTVDDDPGYLDLAAVAVSLQRSLIALDAERREPDGE